MYYWDILTNLGHLLFFQNLKPKHDSMRGRKACETGEEVGSLVLF